LRGHRGQGGAACGGSGGITAKALYDARGQEVNMRGCIAVSVVLGLLGCASPKNNGKRNSEVNTKVTEADPNEKDRQEMSSDGLLVRRFDVNRDDKPDMVKFFRVTKGEELLARMEQDLNFDGKPDVWRIYDASRTLTKQKMDMDFDGKIDSTTIFENGQVIRREEDLDFDQKPDLWKFYDKGKIARKEADINRDGKVDYWEYYEDGKVDRIGIDRDADGEVDDWQKAQTEG
jgi:antitoxin component YwqK of YwqJK toxin-antitoxin module